MDGTENYEVYLRVSDGGDERHLYLIEQWFQDRPAVETIKALLDEAKRDFATLYPDVDADDYSVEIRRLRPNDNHRAGATAT